ncbi:MAG: hypothetical protein AAF721_22835 [Myxococcota bacterium]
MRARTSPSPLLTLPLSCATLLLGCAADERDAFDEFPPAAEGGSSQGAEGDDSGEESDTGGEEPGGEAETGDPAPDDADTGDADSGEPEPGDTGTTEPEPDTICGKSPGFPREDVVPNPTFADQVNVNSTIVIDEPGVYDFENVLHVWTGSGSCNQNENQPYILRIASSDVTLKNFAYQNAPDGIHIGTANDGQGYSYGDSIDNIVLDNVTGWACEDALTTQYGVEHITIQNSTFLANPNPDYRDKLLQLNFGDATIENTTFWGSDTCVMFKGDQDVIVRDSTFIDCKRGINGSTIHGIVGSIGTGHSTLHTECNASYYADLAWKFWGGFKLATAYADVDATSVNDMVYDNGIHEAQDGGSLTATCHPDIEAADLCGPVQVEF